MSDASLPNVGDYMEEHINQGMRPGTVVAVDAERGQYLWEYDMPNGTSALVLYGSGKHGRRTVSYAALSDRWMRLIEEQHCGGLDRLVAWPQSVMARVSWVTKKMEFARKHPELFKEEVNERQADGAAGSGDSVCSGTI